MLCLQEDEISVMDQDVARITEEIRVAEEEVHEAREEVARVENSIGSIQSRINQQIGEVESLNVSGVGGCTCTSGVGRRVWEVCCAVLISSQ